MNRLQATPTIARGAFSLAAAFAVLFGLAVSTPSADVITRSKLESTGFLGLAAFKSESEARQSADKRDDRSKTFFTGAMMKFVSGKKGMDGRSITRLDKEVMWTLNPKEKEYTEVTFDEYRAMLNRPLTEAQGQGKDNPKGSPYKSAGETTVDVEKTGKTFKVSGYEGKGIIATVRMPYFDSLENRKDTLVVKYDAFLTGDAGLAKEMSTFNRNFASKLKLDLDKFRGLEAFYHYLEKPMTKLGEKIGKTGEFPLKFTLTVMKPMPPEAKSAKQENKKEDTGVKVPTSVGDAAGEAMGLAFGYFRKKKEKENQAKAEAKKAELGVPEGYVLISSNAFEYTDIKIAPTTAGDYELPKDYKKVEKSQQQAAKPE